PVNYFKLGKVKMDEIHRYLLEKGVTFEKCPHVHHTHQHDRSRQLVSILFPGYPIIKASDQYYRQMRENKNQSKIISLAYDLLPTNDKYERLEEMFRAPVDWSSKTYEVKIPLKLLNRARVGEWQPLTEADQAMLHYGFFHLDLTDKSTAITQANRRTQGDVTLAFDFTEPPRTRHVSVCAVWEKSVEEMTSQVYVQTASLYISQAMERASRKPLEVDAVQKQVRESKSFSHPSMIGQEPTDLDEAEIIAGDEYVSITDPILLSPIQHPARCTFCTHHACFDAMVFLKFQSTFMQWKCPICNIKIRGIQVHTDTILFNNR
ncbi:hypothetical protein BY458DRAFT_440350, partial [Sporodiniella umbellata]